MEIGLPPDFKEFLRLLKAHGVEYLVIGGYAVGYHGYARATQDLDVWIGPANPERMVAALRAFGFGVPELSSDLFLRERSVVRMGVAPMRIAVLTTISGLRFEECYPHRITDILDGVEVSLISLPHLKANKRASGRHRDLDDVEHLP